MVGGQGVREKNMLLDKGIGQQGGTEEDPIVR